MDAFTTLALLGGAAIALWVGVMMAYYASHRDPRGTRNIPSTTSKPPAQNVVSFYGGLAWRRIRIGATDVKAPFARLDVGTEGIAIRPALRAAPFYVPTWLFGPSDVRAENGGWAVRLVVNDSKEILFQPILQSVAGVFLQMERRGVTVVHDVPPAQYLKL